MKNFIALFVLQLCCYEYHSKAVPFRKFTHNNTDTTLNGSMQGNYHDSTENLLPLLEDNALNTVKSCIKFQMYLETVLPILNSGQFSFQFNQLTLEPISCQPYQIIRRMQVYITILMRFKNALNSMVAEPQIAPKERQILTTISSSLKTMLITQMKLLEHFQGSWFAEESTPSLSELQSATDAYLINYHPDVVLSADEIKYIRTFNFMAAIIKVVNTIDAEYKIAMPSNI